MFLLKPPTPSPPSPTPSDLTSRLTEMKHSVWKRTSRPSHLHEDFIPVSLSSLLYHFPPLCWIRYKDKSLIFPSSPSSRASFLYFSLQQHSLKDVSKLTVFSSYSFHSLFSLHQSRFFSSRLILQELFSLRLTVTSTLNAMDTSPSSSYFSPPAAFETEVHSVLLKRLLHVIPRMPHSPGFLPDFRMLSLPLLQDHLHLPDFWMLKCSRAQSLNCFSFTSMLIPELISPGLLALNSIYMQPSAYPQPGFLS